MENTYLNKGSGCAAEFIDRYTWDHNDGGACDQPT